MARTKRHSRKKQGTAKERAEESAEKKGVKIDAQPSIAEPSKKRLKTTDKTSPDDDDVPEFEKNTAILPSQPEVAPTGRRPGEIRTPPPQPPPSVLPTNALLPPEADDAKLRGTHDIQTVSIASSSKIESKVHQVLTLLKIANAASGSTKDATPSKKSDIIALTARAEAGNKCISIAEIAKREFAKQGVGLWQYTGTWTRLETVDSGKKSQDATKDAKAVEGEDEVMEAEVHEGVTLNEDEDDEDFETMQMPDRKRVRNKVCLVIYLATEPVLRLKELYGEQVTGPEKTGFEG